MFPELLSSIEPLFQCTDEIFMQQNKLASVQQQGGCGQLHPHGRVQLACASIHPSPTQSSIFLWKEAGIRLVQLSALWSQVDLSWQRGKVHEDLTLKLNTPKLKSDLIPFVLQLTNEGQNKVSYGQSGSGESWKQWTTLKRHLSH